MQTDVRSYVLAEIFEARLEDLGHQVQRRTLVPSMSIVMDERASSAAKRVLLEDCDRVASTTETRGESGTSRTGTNDDDFFATSFGR